MKPDKGEAAYLLLLEKSSTQEEYIRGAMTNNPYNSLEVGPLMRDIKNYICSHLDLAGEPMSLPFSGYLWCTY